VRDADVWVEDLEHLAEKHLVEMLAVAIHRGESILNARHITIRRLATNWQSGRLEDSIHA
jgi:hypothetical protein